MATCRGHWLTHASHGHLPLSGNRGHQLISQLYTGLCTLMAKCALDSQAPGQASHRAEPGRDSSTHLTLTQWKYFHRGGSISTPEEENSMCVVGLSMSWDAPKACPGGADAHPNVSMLLRSLPSVRNLCLLLSASPRGPTILMPA